MPRSLMPAPRPTWRARRGPRSKQAACRGLPGAMRFFMDFQGIRSLGKRMLGEIQMNTSVFEATVTLFGVGGKGFHTQTPAFPVDIPARFFGPRCPTSWQLGGGFAMVSEEKKKEGTCSGRGTSYVDMHLVVSLNGPPRAEKTKWGVILKPWCLNCHCVWMHSTFSVPPKSTPGVLGATVQSLRPAR